MSSIAYGVEANLRLDTAGFEYLSFADLYIPPIKKAEAFDGSVVPYMQFGDRAEAKAFVFMPLAYSGSLSNPSEQVHMFAYQKVLGKDYCLVGVQPYDPKDNQYQKEDLKKIAKGDWQPMADRVLTVIKEVNPGDDQELILYGYSLGADVSVETAFQMLTNEQRGIRKVDKLGAVEYARGKDRGFLGGLAIMRAFSKSGKNLFQNVVDSDSPALLEARGIDLSDPKAQKKHKKAVARSVTAYALSDIGATLAGFSGAATNRSLRQLNIIGKNRQDAPRITVGHMDDSLICPDESTLYLERSIRTFRESGDHSTGDNIRRSASFVLQVTAD